MSWLKLIFYDEDVAAVASYRSTLLPNNLIDIEFTANDNITADVLVSFSECRGLAKRLAVHDIKTVPIGSAMLTLGDDGVLAYVPVTDIGPDSFQMYWAIRGLLRLLEQIQCASAVSVAIPCVGDVNQVSIALDDHCRGNVAICDPERDTKVLISNNWIYLLSDNAI